MSGFSVPKFGVKNLGLQPEPQNSDSEFLIPNSKLHKRTARLGPEPQRSIVLPCSCPGLDSGWFKRPVRASVRVTIRGTIQDTTRVTVRVRATIRIT